MYFYRLGADFICFCHFTVHLTSHWMARMWWLFIFSESLSHDDSNDMSKGYSQANSILTAW